LTDYRTCQRTGIGLNAALSALCCTDFSWRQRFDAVLPQVIQLDLYNFLQSCTTAGRKPKREKMKKILINQIKIPNRAITQRY
jgi:hypothetical protein